jgi:hypothetical protein
LVAEKRKFQREICFVLGDELIYAAGVGFQNFARFGIEKGGVALGGTCEAVGAKTLIDLESSGSQDFGELTACGAAEEIHLPEAILRHNVALGFRQVFYGCGADVRHAPAIPFDGDFLAEAGEGSAASDLRERAVDEPPGNGGGRNYENGEDPVEDSKNDSQVRSRPI